MLNILLLKVFEVNNGFPLLQNVSLLIRVLTRSASEECHSLFLMNQALLAYTREQPNVQLNHSSDTSSLCGHSPLPFLNLTELSPITDVGVCASTALATKTSVNIDSQGLVSLPTVDQASCFRPPTQQFLTDFQAAYTQTLSCEHKSPEVTYNCDKTLFVEASLLRCGCCAECMEPAMSINDSTSTWKLFAAARSSFHLGRYKQLIF